MSQGLSTAAGQSLEIDLLMSLQGIAASPKEPVLNVTGSRSVGSDAWPTIEISHSQITGLEFAMR